MNCAKYGKKATNYAAKSLALMASVFLTACSPSLNEMNLWAGDQPQAAAAMPPPVKVGLVNDAKPLPDLPANLVKCIEANRKPKGQSADEKVIAFKKTMDERRACMSAILKFYKELQKSERTKRASVDPPKPLSP